MWRRAWSEPYHFRFDSGLDFPPALSIAAVVEAKSSSLLCLSSISSMSSTTICESRRAASICSRIAFINLICCTFMRIMNEKVGYSAMLSTICMSCSKEIGWKNIISGCFGVGVVEESPSLDFIAALYSSCCRRRFSCISAMRRLCSSASSVTSRSSSMKHAGALSKPSFVANRFKCESNIFSYSLKHCNVVWCWNFGGVSRNSGNMICKHAPALSACC